MSRLGSAAPPIELSKKKAIQRLEQAQQRMLRLRLILGGQAGENKIGPPLICVFEGWDASGKGGAIKRLVAPLDPRFVRVAQFAAPTYDEKRHHFLWRFWPNLPGWGGMAVFDRSWYGRVLVERVEGFATEEQWSRAYNEIVEFERTLVAEGMIIVKFWMHVSPEEQLRRFEDRVDRPASPAGSSPTRTGATARSASTTRTRSTRCWNAPTTTWAPWHVIPGDYKYYARFAVVEKVCEAVEAELERRGYDLSTP